MKTEFEFIENLRRDRRLSRIGDDCAVLPKDSKTELVITTDLLVEDVDFRLAWTKPELIGHKALAVSLSDVAAMGAKPVWSMVSLGVPEKIWKSGFVDEFYNGYMALAKKFEVELVGGDVSRTPERIVIDSIAAGETRKSKAVLRSGAKVGDSIFVTGALGGAAAGLKLLEEGFRYNSAEKLWRKKLLLKQLAPLPQVAAGSRIGGKNLATSMIDLSDGLSSDLAHICRESRSGARVFAEKIPLHKHLGALTNSFDESLKIALDGGEDFELLFTVSPKKISRLRREFANFPFHKIGEITANAGIIELIAGTDSRILDARGFRHF